MRFAEAGLRVVKIAEGRSGRLKRLVLIGTAIIVLTAMTANADEKEKAAIPPIPTPGLVTMVDLGAHKCIPCKLMAPIIADLQKEYAGLVTIFFIDVWEDRDQARRFGIRGIPTQIFYDKAGNEVGRHVGFMDKKSIIAVFSKLGVEK